MSRAASWIAELGGWRRAGFGILIGALSVLAFAPVHAWPEFHAFITKHIHDCGVPKQLADLVRVGENWFRDRDADNVPDISTIRKKLQPVWTALRTA